MDIRVFLILLYMLLSVVFVGVIYLFTKQKTQWSAIDFLSIILLPIVTWFILLLLNIKVKGLANLIEIPVLAIGSGLVGLLGLVFEKIAPGKRTLFNIIVSILVAVCLYFLMPSVPEYVEFLH